MTAINLLNSTPNEAQANYLRTKIVDVLDTYLCMGRTIKDTDNFVSDLGADSIDQVEMVMALEDEFEFEITDEDGDAMQTIDTTMRVLHDKLIDKMTPSTYRAFYADMQ